MSNKFILELDSSSSKEILSIRVTYNAIHANVNLFNIQNYLRYWGIRKFLPSNNHLIILCYFYLLKLITRNQHSLFIKEKERATTTHRMYEEWRHIDNETFSFIIWIPRYNCVFHYYSKSNSKIQNVTGSEPTIDEGTNIILLYILHVVK